jgi:hypothetical protein
LVIASMNQATERDRDVHVQVDDVERERDDAVGRGVAVERYGSIPTVLAERLGGGVLENVQRLAGADHELLQLEVVVVRVRVVENVSGVRVVRLLVLGALGLRLVPVGLAGLLVALEHVDDAALGLADLLALLDRPRRVAVLQPVALERLLAARERERAQLPDVPLALELRAAAAARPRPGLARCS